VTGLDLVREQLRIAMGESLGFAQSDVRVDGAAIEVRLYAEDPAAGFLPATGTLAAFEPAATPEVRWDSGVESGSVVGVDFDPMLAKVIAHAPTRTEAASRLALALERLHLAGVTTNRDFLVSTLRHPGFLSGDTTTDFIERLGPAPVLELADDEMERVATLAALWLQGRNRAEATVLAAVASGWRNARLPPQQTTFSVNGRTVDVRYASRRDGSFAVGDDTARVHAWTPSSIDAEVGGRRSSARVTLTDGRVFVQAGRGTVALDVVPRFVVPGASLPTGGFVAPMHAVVIDVRCQPGDDVKAGQTLIVLEAMKMEHHMNAPADGRIAEVKVATGQQVENGAVLIVFEESANDGGNR
jgi:propionyl-CoA carboxylase alpha chain